MTQLELLNQIISSTYSKQDYPALQHQADVWSVDRPLQGVRILDATPVFRNTLAKYIPLIAAGAEVTVGRIDAIEPNAETIAFLNRIGIKITDKDTTDTFDIILDCAAAYAHLDAQIGYVELTRSGVELYRNHKKPVFVADGGAIKRIETSLGTGESYFRAMTQLGYTDWHNKKIVIFGSGKVGSGIIMYAHRYGAQITIVTDLTTLSDRIKNYGTVVDFRNVSGVHAALEDAYAVVTATGVAAAIGRAGYAEQVAASAALLANMGVADEFGTEVPESRVLNNKQALNFILEEPTHLKYIDATMALHNVGALYIMQHRHLSGLIIPPSEIEAELLRITRLSGVISDEMDMIF